MKIICDRAALVEALNLVTSVTPSRTPKPILACVKLTAAAGTLTLSATDLEVGLRFTTPRVEIQEQGEALVTADKLSSIVRDSPDSTLTLESDKDSLHIRTKDARFKIHTQSTDEFPPLPTFAGEADFALPANELTRLIQQTIYATARENSRYAINGVLIDRSAKQLTVVATDGHRLAVSQAECQTSHSDHRSAIVPTRGLNTLVRLLGTSEQIVKIKVAENQILFATDSALLISNLVEGSFPPYKDVIPRDGDKKASLRTDALSSAFRRASLLTTEESKGVRLAFNPDALTISSRTAEIGEAEIRVDLASYEGEPVEVGFNPQYVLDVLKVISTDVVQMDLRAPNKSVIIRSGTDFLYVVMPVSL